MQSNPSNPFLKFFFFRKVISFDSLEIFSRLKKQCPDAEVLRVEVSRGIYYRSGPNFNSQ